MSQKKHIALSLNPKEDIPILPAIQSLSRVSSLDSFQSLPIVALIFHFKKIEPKDFLVYVGLGAGRERGKN